MTAQNPGAGKPVDQASLANVPRLVTAYFVSKPDPADPAQRVAFTACTVTRTLMMIDLQSMKLSGPWPVVLKPDILRLDLGLHRLYVPGSSGVSIFDEQAATKGTVKKVGDFVVSKGTSHTMTFNPSTHLLYFAVQDNQGRAVERIEL